MLGGLVEFLHPDTAMYLYDDVPVWHLGFTHVPMKIVRIGYTGQPWKTRASQQ
jgi:hypothetical protein